MTGGTRAIALAVGLCVIGGLATAAVLRPVGGRANAAGWGLTERSEVGEQRAAGALDGPYWELGQPGAAGWALIAAGLAATLAGVALGSRSGRSRRAAPRRAGLLALAVPALLAATAAGVWLAGSLELAGWFEQANATRRTVMARTSWFDYMAPRYALPAVLGIGWSALAFAGVALAAGGAARSTETGPARGRWVWRLLGPLAAVTTLLLPVWAYGDHVLTHRAAEGEIVGVGRAIGFGLRAFGSGEVAGLLLPLLGAAALLALAPVWLTRGGGRAPDDEVRAAARAVAGAGLAGAIGGLALLVPLYAGMRAIQYGAWLLSVASPSAKQAVLAASSASPFGVYHSLGGATAVLSVAAIVAALVFPAALRRAPAWSAAALALPALALLALVGARAAGRGALDEVVGPYCVEQCSEIERMVALASSRPLQSVLRVETTCSNDVTIPADERLVLPRVVPTGCPEVAVNLAVYRDVIEVDGVRVLPLVDRAIPADELDDAGTPYRLYDHLLEKVDDASALAARNPNQPFRGRILLLFDRDTPLSLVDQVRRVAAAAGFGWHEMIVQHPDDRVWNIDGTLNFDPHDRGVRLLPPDVTWRLHVAADALTLTSPTGQRWSDGDASKLVTIAREQLADGAAARAVIVDHDPAVAYRREVEARAALAGRDGPFQAAFSGADVFPN